MAGVPTKVTPNLLMSKLARPLLRPNKRRH
jgi:hypothetical protein